MACVTAFCALGIAGQAEARGHHHKESKGRQAAGIIHAVADTIRAVTGQPDYVVTPAPAVVAPVVVTPAPAVVAPVVVAPAPVVTPAPIIAPQPSPVVVAPAPVVTPAPRLHRGRHR